MDNDDSTIIKGKPEVDKDLVKTVIKSEYYKNNFIPPQDSWDFIETNTADDDFTPLKDSIVYIRKFKDSPKIKQDNIDYNKIQNRLESYEKVDQYAHRVCLYFR